MSQYTLRLDWGTSAKEEDANTQDFSRDLWTIYVFFQMLVGRL